MSAFSSRMRELRNDAHLSLDALGRVAHVTPSYLSRIERGVVPDPAASTALAIDRALGAGGTLAALARQEAAPAVADLASRLDSDPGRPLDESDVHDLRDRIGQLVDLDGAVGGDQLWQVAVQLLRPAQAKLAAGRYAAAHEADLRSTVAELAQLGGWLAYDADRQDDAWGLYAEAILDAELAGNHKLEWFARDQRCLQYLHRGRAAEALKMADRALADPRTRGQMAAISRVRRARALAAVGDRSALDEMTQAKAELQAGAGGAETPWTSWMTGPEQDLHDALVHSGVGLHRQAADLAARSIDGLPARRQRDAGVYWAYLGQILATAGAWSDLIATWSDQRRRGVRTGSTRTANLVVSSATRAGAPARVAEAARDLIAVR